MERFDRLIRGFLTYLEIERGFSPNTVAAYRQDLEGFVRTLASEHRAEPRSIRERHVFDYIVAERRRGRGPSSVRRSLSALKTFCRFLLRERVLETDPTAQVEAPKTWKRLPATLELEEFERLLAAIPESGARYPLRDLALLELGFATGLRVSELTGLELGSVRRDLGIVRCLGKGSRERVVPVSQTALAALDRYLEIERPRLARHRPAASASSGLLFLSRSGGPLGREVVARLLKRYARAAGLATPVTPHTLRHSLATLLLRGGADLRVVQEILGHVKPETTEIYTHIERSELKALHQRFHPRG